MRCERSATPRRPSAPTTSKRTHCARACVLSSAAARTLFLAETERYLPLAAHRIHTRRGGASGLDTLETMRQKGCRGGGGGGGGERGDCTAPAEALDGLLLIEAIASS